MYITKQCLFFWTVEAKRFFTDKLLNVMFSSAILFFYKKIYGPKAFKSKACVTKKVSPFDFIDLHKLVFVCIQISLL
jgi:hypothetical protein